MIGDRQFGDELREERGDFDVQWLTHTMGRIIEESTRRVLDHSVLRSFAQALRFDCSFVRSFARSLVRSFARSLARSLTLKLMRKRRWSTGAGS